MTARRVTADREDGSGYRELIDEIEDLLDLRRDPRPWIQANLRIRTKDRRIVPFRLNAVQADYYQRRTARDLILKPRQLGFTTLVCGLFFADTVLHPNTTSAIVVHEGEAGERIFGIIRLYWDRLPEEERREIGEPRYSTRRELVWAGLNSRIYVVTAGALDPWRGQTINNLHCSELAFWPRPEEALASLREAVPEEGRIVIESTPNGMGNFFHDLWVQAKQGENGYTHHFYEWWQDPAYRLQSPDPPGDLSEEENVLVRDHSLSVGQIRWRRAKVRELRDRFPQEYPEDDVTCFRASGRCCFDVEALKAAQQRIASEPKPESISVLRAGDGTSISVAPARLLVWRRPEEGREYVIGADVGEGLAHGDPSAACVLDRETGEQVAELHGRVPPGTFAKLLAAVGRLYRDAELAVERNNHGYTTLQALDTTLHYVPLYHHRRYDQSGSGGKVLGWPTTGQTKPVMIDDLAEAIAEGYLLVHSTGLIDECLTFVLTDTGSQQAQPGKHDDRVMAAAIAWQARKHPTPQPRIRVLYW